MDPGCFCRCFNRYDDTLAMELDTSRATKKPVIKIMRKSPRRRLNPEQPNHLEIYSRQQPTEPNSSLFANVQLKKLQMKDLKVQLQRQNGIVSSQDPKNYRPFKNLSILDQTSLLMSARSDNGNRLRQRRPSSLYGGAKGIINRMSHFEEHLQAEQTEQSRVFRQKKVSQNSLSIKEHLTIRNSYKWFNESEYTQNEDVDPFQAITIPQIKTTFKLTKEAINGLKVGKILGRGKYSHSYLSQDTNTHCLFTIKYIFKKAITPATLSSISHSINLQQQMNHPLIVDCYAFSEDEEKITIIGEYTFTLLYDSINLQSTFALSRVKQYLKQIIEAVIIMHENNRAHGNLSPIQVGYTMGVCKVRMSLTNSQNLHDQFIKDIHAIGLMGYEMAYGLIKCVDKHNPLRDQHVYYNIPDLRERVIRELIVKKIEKPYMCLNNFLQGMLTQNENIRLCASNTLTHPFFSVRELGE